MIRVSDKVSLEDWELTETFIRASGPGGQHVNKVETAVQLRFNLRSSPSLTAPIKERLAKIAGRRLTKDGELIIEAKRFRSRERNREDARARLMALILRALAPPRKRVARKVSKNQKRKRLDDKRHRALTKTRRAAPKRTAPETD